MHVAFWSPAWPLQKFQNGIVTYVHWMKLALELQGHRVSVFTEETDQQSYPRVYKVARPTKPLWKRSLYRLTKPWRLYETCVFEFSSAISQAMLEVHRSDPIDVIEMEESFGWFADVERSTSIPLLVKLHGPAFLSLVDGELDTPLGRARIRKEGEALATARTIASPTYATLTETIQRYRLAPTKCKVIPNPIPTRSDTPIWNLEHCDRDTILFVGRFDLRKGADIAVNAFAEILRQQPEAKLIFVGPDIGIPGAAGEMIGFREFISTIIPEAQRDRIDYRGRLTNQEISVLRTRAMVTIVPSRWENPGYTALESMYQGCPIVCSDVAGCREIITHGETGLLAKNGNSNDFATQILAMLTAPAKARAMGKAARRHVIEHYSGSKVVAASLELYEQVISDGRLIGGIKPATDWSSKTVGKLKQAAQLTP